MRAMEMRTWDLTRVLGIGSEMGEKNFGREELWELRCMSTWCIFGVMERMASESIPIGEGQTLHTGFVL
jgi:hypothetical protein